MRTKRAMTPSGHGPFPIPCVASGACHSGDPWEVSRATSYDTRTFRSLNNVASKEADHGRSSFRSVCALAGVRAQPARVGEGDARHRGGGTDGRRVVAARDRGGATRIQRTDLSNMDALPSRRPRGMLRKRRVRAWRDLLHEWHDRQFGILLRSQLGGSLDRVLLHATANERRYPGMHLLIAPNW
jgi:hypothetical protein